MGISDNLEKELALLLQNWPSYKYFRLFVSLVFKTNKKGHRWVRGSKVGHSYDSTMIQVYLKYPFSMLQVAAKYALSMLQICSKLPPSMLQVFF